MEIPLNYPEMWDKFPIMNVISFYLIKSLCVGLSDINHVETLYKPQERFNFLITDFQMWP